MGRELTNRRQKQRPHDFSSPKLQVLPSIVMIYKMYYWIIKLSKIKQTKKSSRGWSVKSHTTAVIPSIINVGLDIKDIY